MTACSCACQEAAWTFSSARSTKPVSPRSIPPYTEEIAQQCRGARAVASTCHRRTVVTGRLGEELRTMQDCAAFRIFRREYQALDACQADRAGAHRARLERDVERRSDEPLVSQLRGCRAQNQLLGVCRRVLAFDDAI